MVNLNYMVLLIGFEPTCKNSLGNWCPSLGPQEHLMYLVGCDGVRPPSTWRPMLSPPAVPSHKLVEVSPSCHTVTMLCLGTRDARLHDLVGD